MSRALSFLENMAGYMLLALPVWIFLRTLYQLKREIRPHWVREIGMAIFVLYLVGLASQTICVFGGGWSPLSDALDPISYARMRWAGGYGINLVPFATVKSMLRFGSFSQKLINLAGNVLIFIPLGCLLPALWKRLRRCWKTIPLCAAVSLLIESVQLFVGRSVDVDDLILNTLGGALGYLLFALLFFFLRLLRKPKRSKS